MESRFQPGSEGIASHERTIRTGRSRIEANKYRSRGESVEVSFNGTTEHWYSMKGGLQRKKVSANLNLASSEILFNPESNQWLKIVPAEVKNSSWYNTMAEKLKTSEEAGRLSLRLSGLDHLASQFVDGDVEIRGQTVYGFTSPHIGPTLEYYLARGKASPTEALQNTLLTPADIYARAFHLAARLYLNHGFWTPDANPGNIILHFPHSDAPPQVTLIDLLGKEQKRPNDVDTDTDHEKYSRHIQQLLSSNIGALYNEFLEKSTVHEIPLTRALEPVEEVFSSLVPQRKQYLLSVHAEQTA